MTKIITRLESYVNGDRSGMTQIYRDAIVEINQRDHELKKLKQGYAEMELKLLKARAELEILTGHLSRWIASNRK